MLSAREAASLEYLRERIGAPSLAELIRDLLRSKGFCEGEGVFQKVGRSDHQGGNDERWLDLD